MGMRLGLYSIDYTIFNDIWSDGLELVAQAIYLKADTGIQSSLLDYHF